MTKLFVAVVVACSTVALGQRSGPGAAEELSFERPFSLSDQPGAGEDQAAAGRQGSGSSEDLAKQLANPVASLISVPFQFNWDTGYDGAEGRGGDRYLMNVQPVVPFSIGRDWNLITRTIVPVVYQDDLFIDGASSQYGLGDTTQSFFLSPKERGPLGAIWGVGPAFLWPTGTNDSLGGGKWGVGPTGVVLFQHGPWTYGALANHIWSYAGDGDRPYVNATFLQPFVNYTTKTATSFVLNMESTYDWRTNQWTVPINFDVNQLLKVGKYPVQIGGGFRWYAEAPDGGPDWGIRINLVFLFPK